MKKTCIKILSVVLCAVMVLGAAPLGGFVGLDLPQLFDFKAEAATYSGTCGTNLTWSLDTDTDVLNITGTGAMTNYSSSSSVPWYSYRNNIKTATIASGVTTIGDWAFRYCDSLTSVTIGNSVTTIGSYAFYGCTSLTSVTIPDSVTTIGDDAFAWCDSLTSVTIGNSVTTIGDGAFAWCDNLTSVTIPDSVTTIGNSAFWDCRSLTSVTIGNSVTTIGSSAFEYCTSLSDVYYTGTEAQWKKIAIDSYNNPLKNATIHFAEPTIASGKCGENVTWTLYENGLLEITGTGAMTNYTYFSNAPWYSYSSKIKTVNIASGVTTIGEYAFKDCTSLTSVTIPDSVTTIGGWAFIHCDSLTSVTIPGSVTTIGKSAFYSCDSLTSVTIGNSVTTIGDYAFEGCDSLTSITIPDSVKTIGDEAFAVCFNLTSITVDENNKNYSSDSCGVLFNKDKTELIQYPIGNARTSYTIPDSVTTIGNYAFCYCTSLTSVTIPDSVTTIGDRAFYSCDSLTDVYYTGSEAQWKKIAIDSYNDPLKNATIHYNHVHALNNVIESVDPTCYKAGYKTGTCVCGYSLTEEIPLLNHKDTLVKVEAKAPTCTEIGWDAHEYCTACTYTTYAEKPALKHDIVIDKAVDATCTETGLTEGQHCSRCDDATIKQEFVPVKPHNYTAKHDSAKHWEECFCGSKTKIQNHTFVGGNVCSCGFKRTVDSTIKIKNNSGSKTINYGETLKLMATVTDKPANAKIYWYVDGELKGEGEIFEVKFESGTKIVSVKLVDENGVVYQNANGEEISESENVTVNAGFFQKLISFFKNLFRMNRTVVQ